ncbi:MAG TPA: hypothetical protein VN408_38175 [Actinoplanes sp.]|nr:hypothetical protein [Actinoplanes sp.]
MTPQRTDDSRNRAACVVEVCGITLQAWRGVPSHFDTETPFDRVVAMTLAAGGAVLVVTLGMFALHAVPALPLLAVLLHRTGLTERLRGRIVTWAVALHVLATALALVFSLT